jgi:hypothetical protein
LKGSVLRGVARGGVRRGLVGAGGRGWLILGLATGLIRFLRRKRDEPKLSVSEELEPGESILITHLRKDEAG